MAEKDHANALIPPPLALTLCVVAACLIDRVWPAPFLPLGLPRWLIGGALIVTGLAIEAWSFLVFRRARTSVLPMRPTSAIVEAGLTVIPAIRSISACSSRSSGSPSL